MHWKSSENRLALLKQATDQLVLSEEQLCQIAQILNDELNIALKSSRMNPRTQSLRVYPTYIDQVPDGCELGKYLALDLGGTNFRVLLIHLEGNGHSSVQCETFSISQELMKSDGPHLFDYIARCLYNFVNTRGLLGQRLMLGFTFSFPCEQKSRFEAVLTKWTKGFSCADTVGHEVGAMLTTAISKHTGLLIQVAAIVNDTTGTLISCAYQESDCRIGVIIGTGVNMCYMDSSLAIHPMIINTELGAFGSGNKCLDFVRTQWDRELDNESINRGEQLFEKMVSGMYLGELVRLTMVDLIERNIVDRDVFGKFVERHYFATSLISQVEQDSADSVTWPHTTAVFKSLGIGGVTAFHCECLHLVCSRVSRRSAHLTSAAIASLLGRMKRNRTVIGVDGSVFRCHPHYKSIMNETIHRLLQCKRDTQHLCFRLMLSKDGSGRGAALVAALPLPPTLNQLHVTRSSQSTCATCNDPNYALTKGQIACQMCAVLT